MQRRKAIHPFSNNALIYSSCSQLQYFSTFQLFDYERLVNILLFIVSEHKGEENNFVQRAGICLLNSLACQVSSCGPSYKKIRGLIAGQFVTFLSFRDATMKSRTKISQITFSPKIGYFYFLFSLGGYALSIPHPHQ